MSKVSARNLNTETLILLFHKKINILLDCMGKKIDIDYIMQNSTTLIEKISSQVTEEKIKKYKTDPENYTIKLIQENGVIPNIGGNLLQNYKSSVKTQKCIFSIINLAIEYHNRSKIHGVL